MCDITKKVFCFFDHENFGTQLAAGPIWYFFSDRGNYINDQNQISEIKKETTSVKPHGLGWWMVDILCAAPPCSLFVPISQSVHQRYVS